MVALSQSALEIWAPLLKGGAKFPVFLDREIGTLLLGDHFEALVAMNSVVAVLNPDGVTPILNYKRPGRKSGLERIDESFCFCFWN